MTDQTHSETPDPGDEPEPQGRPPCRPAADIDDQIVGLDTQLHEALGCDRFTELHHVLSQPDEAGFRRSATRLVLNISRDPDVIANVAHVMGSARFNSVVELLAHNLDLGDIVHACARSRRTARATPPRPSVLRAALDTGLGATRATALYVLAAPVVPWLGAFSSYLDRFVAGSPAQKAQTLEVLDRVLRTLRQRLKTPRPATAT